MSIEVFEIDVDNADVSAMLLALPDRIVRKALFKAHRAASKVIEERLLERTPRSDHDGDLPHLSDSIVTSIQVNADERTGESRTGFGVAGHKAFFVEYGHRLVGHRPLKKEEGTVEPNPFMAGAASAASEDAIQAFADSISQSLEE